MKILYKVSSSVDETIKYQLSTSDGLVIEACVIFFFEEIAKINICVSSQVGCICNCMFCATGNKRFIRNLTAKEIIEQVTIITDDISLKTNQLFEITYMGTGEPLNNVDEVLESMHHIESVYSNLHRINLSTVLPSLNISLEQLLSTRHPIHFQYSMHFTKDELREKYFRNKLPTIYDSLSFFNTISKKTDEMFCINYLLFDGINDTIDDARRLIKFCKSLNAYIKISEYCPIKHSSLKPSKNFCKFVGILDDEHITWKSFQSKGADIKASCGHLLSEIEF